MAFTSTPSGLTAFARRTAGAVPEGRRSPGRPSVTSATPVTSARQARETRSGLDFVSDRTFDGKSIKILTVLDEHTREALVVRVERKMSAVGSEVALIAPGSPWQNERLNGILVEEVLSREVWGNLLEAQVVWLTNFSLDLFFGGWTRVIDWMTRSFQSTLELPHLSRKRLKRTQT